MTTYLDFEKPIAELESKIAELRHLPNSADVDIADEVMRLQDKHPLARRKRRPAG